MTEPTPATAHPPWVRSYAARRGRRSVLTLERMERLLPERGIPDGPLDPGSVFGRHAPLVLEVGCGHGAAALAHAVAYPEADVLAVDVHTAGIARLLAAADEAEVPNLRVHQGDAVQLLAERVPSSSLAAVHLFFPDPWPKAKHAKRRFVRPLTLDLVHARLVEGAALLVATDVPGYAEHALAELAAHGGFDVVVGDRPAWRPRDGFESKALAAGLAVTEIRATRR